MYCGLEVMLLYRYTSYYYLLSTSILPDPIRFPDPTRSPHKTNTAVDHSVSMRVAPLSERESYDFLT
jgi:hypothetical protein